jgi:hypothetical protein
MLVLPNADERSIKTQKKKMTSDADENFAPSPVLLPP